MEQAVIALRIEIEGAALSSIDLAPGEYSFGSDVSNAIVIDHPTVSGRHGDLFVQTDGQVIVLDAGSANGIWVDGEQTGKATLSPGQVFFAGTAAIAIEKHQRMAVPRRIPTAGRGHAAAVVRTQSNPPPTASAAPVLARTFFAEFPDALAYPFRGDAWLYIAIAAALENVPNLLPIVAGVAALGIGIIVGSFLMLLWQQIVLTTIDGKDQFPNFPNFSLDWQENLTLYLRYIMLAWVCFGPVFFCNNAKVWGWDPPFWMIYCCFGFGCLYFPMALLAFIVTDSFAVLNPVFFVRSCLKKLSDYLLLVIFLGLILGGGYGLTFLFKASPGAASSFVSRVLAVTGNMIAEAVGLFFILVWLRLLGLFYRRHKDCLNWC